MVMAHCVAHFLCSYVGFDRHCQFRGTVADRYLDICVSASSNLTVVLLTRNLHYIFSDVHQQTNSSRSEPSTRHAAVQCCIYICLSDHGPFGSGPI